MSKAVRLAAVLWAVILLLTGCGPGAAMARTSASKPAARWRPVRPVPSARTAGPGSPDATLPTDRPAYLPPPPPDPYPHGRFFPVHIPGGASHFDARDGYVYLPPAASHGATRLPVLELLHGVPGQPSDWQVKGDLRQTMDAFAARHGGMAPIVVMPDINGGYHSDTQCVRTPSGGDVEQYLTVQVPRFVLAHYPASRDRRQWAIAGLSEGGFCSLMLALRSYPEYAAIGDFSGLAQPTVGRQGNPQHTIDALFGGSRAAYQHHDPLWLMRRHPLPLTMLWMRTGSGDHEIAHDQVRVAAAARAAGMRVKATTRPGTHSWLVWIPALANFLPWMWPGVSRDA